MSAFKQHLESIKGIDWQARVPEELKEKFAETAMSIDNVTEEELKNTVPYELAGRSLEGAIYYANVGTMFIAEEKDRPDPRTDKLQLLTGIYDSPLLSPFEALIVGATVLEFFTKNQNPLAMLQELFES